MALRLRSRREDAPLHDVNPSDDNGRAAPRGGGHRRRIIIIAVVAAVIVAGGAAWLMLGRSDGEGESTSPGASPATTAAKVERRDLVVSDSYTGTLGYGEARSYASERAGVVTTVAAVGKTLEQGAELFSVDFEPTIVLQGTVPAYRSMSTANSDGPDIKQLETALAALGYGDGLTVDESYTAATASAVENWEQDLGREDPDGTVELGDIVFADGAIRVATVQADIGTRVQSGTKVVDATPTTHVVTVDLDASNSNDLEPGTKVQLTMPDKVATTGTVAEIGTETEAADTGETSTAGPGGGGGPTVPVTITLDHPDTAAAFDTGSVDVDIERSRDDGATAVPVTALVALAEGGYAVQVVDSTQPSGYRLVAVEVGTYAESYVGVTGDEIKPGVMVVVPR